MTGRGQEIVDFMEKRKINIMCVQETKWKGAKAIELGNGFKLFNTGTDRRRNGVGIILDDNLKKEVLSVKRSSDRIIWLRVDMGGEIVNIVSAYAPQTGCNVEEKDEFYEELDDELREIPTSEKLWIGEDFNGLCGNDNVGKEEYIGKHGVGVCNEAGEQFVDFAVRHSLRVVNTFFKKAERYKLTYRSGALEFQNDYILCRTNEKANIRNCKVTLGESVMSQHRPLICTLRGKKLDLKKLAGIPRTKWWKLADRNAQNEFASAAMEKNKKDKETGWWNEKVQQYIKIKKETKKILDQENNVENREAYKVAKKAAKRSVARAKAKAYQRLYDDMETLDGQNRALRIAKQRDKNSKDI
ncbi:craniofacial development protein 2-like [Penaeus chinensis]|uniref:craniofacial development protein 2-like n=1 Tax=Penaeus chinensis TaxID=139456 RepID=UPI001FB8420E|nr:craniofacial development protein 2-like [Penaeus chinensis]